MTPLLVCETVQASALAGLLEARDAIMLPDLVELRLDGVGDLRVSDVDAVLARRRLPIIVTCRPRWEGGGYDGDEETRRALLEGALRGGAEFVDVEWAAPWRDQLLARWRERIVLSFHDFSGTPHDLDRRFADMLSAGAAVTKIAVTTRSLRDMAPLLALRRLVPTRRPTVLIGMGFPGLATRVLPWRFGSSWTYGGAGAAPGQVPVAQLVREFRVRSGHASTAVFGIAGRPVGHSLSPAIHNAAFAARGLDAVFVPFEAADFDDFLWAADAFDVAGASVTAPFKGDALRHTASADEAGREAGAVNTLRREAGGRWAGLNTDLDGFLAPLADVPLEGKRAAILGAGGGARAAAVALARKGARVTIHARNPEQARQVAEATGAVAGAWPPVPDWELLVHATPVGTWPAADEQVVEVPFVHGGAVYDLVYNPPRTTLLRAAEAAGCRVIGGLPMLVAQAARQFEWWTGFPAPVDAMHAAASARLAEFR